MNGRLERLIKPSLRFPTNYRNSNIIFDGSTFMNIRYLIKSKNQNLHYFPISFHELFKSIENGEVKVLDNANLPVLLKGIFSAKTSDKVIIFLFSTQPEYILILVILKIFSSIFRKNLQIYHQMHEPWYEEGRASRRTTFFGYTANLIISRLSNKTILPSSHAVEKAKTFIDKENRIQLNLTFLISKSPQELERKLSELEGSWRSNKTFSLIGGAGPDRNPQGFLRLSAIAHNLYPDTSRFIRAGRDSNIALNYSEMSVFAFPGYVPENTKNFLLDLTHFIVIPYKFSTQSAVIPESLSLGKLLILNDIPAFQYLKGQSFAFLVDFDSEDNLKECLRNIHSMTVEDYRARYWSAIEYFEKFHSNEYLSRNIHLIS